MNCAQLLFSVGWVSYPVHIMVDNFRIEQQFENDFCKILNMNKILEHWLVQREVHEFLIKLCPNPYIPIFSYPAIKFLELSNLGKTMYRNKIYRQNFLSKSILVWIQDLFTLVNHLFTLIIKKKKCLPMWVVSWGWNSLIQSTEKWLKSNLNIQSPL